MVNMMLLSVGPHTVAGSRIDALYALKGVDSARAASCGTSVASCFTGRCHRERWPYLASTGVSGLPASQGGYVFRGVDVPVVDRLSQPRAGESFHREVFHRDRLVFADHLGGG